MINTIMIQQRGLTELHAFRPRRQLTSAALAKDFYVLLKKLPTPRQALALEVEHVVGLDQYKAPVQAVLEYFTGIKPPEYYEINSRKAQVQRVLDDLRMEQRMISQVRERFGQTMPLTGPKVMPENFEHDVARLAEEVSSLNALQEEYRDVAVREQEVLESIRLQVKLATATLSVYDSDTSFLRDQAHATLACPTCGAEHEKPYLDMLTYAEDARVLRELVVRLRGDAGKAADQYNKTKGRLSELESQYQRVSEVLNTRRGELEFGEVVRGIGAEAALQAFESELQSLKAKIDERLSEIDTFTARLQELMSNRRSKEILKLFRDSYASAVISRASFQIPAHSTAGKFNAAVCRHFDLGRFIREYL